jgi:class 3 adenylate cyclase
MAKTDNLTILFTDMVDFTERTSHQSRAENRTMLRTYTRLILPLAARYGGRCIKSIGDAFLIVFRSPTDAVRSAMGMQDALAEYNAGQPEPMRIQIRVSINVGEVRVDGHDVFGEAVNVASRVENITPQNEIYFTEAVYLSMNKAEVPSEPLGEFKLKGIPEPVRLYRVPGHTLNRLMPVGDLNLSEGEFPYGGMHRLSPDSSPVRQWLNVVQEWPNILFLQWSANQKRAALWGLLFLLSLSPLLLLYAQQYSVLPPAVQEAVAPILPGPALPARQQQEVLDEIRKIREAQNHLQKGHIAFAESNREEGLKAYAQALKLDPTVQNNPMLAGNIVGSLGWHTDRAVALIERHPNPAMIDALRQRSSQPGPIGRQRAVDLLRKLGHGNKIDETGLALMNFEEAQTCEERAPHLKRLRALKDPKALPALREALGKYSGLISWFRDRCTSDDINLTIVEIERAQGQQTPS